MVEDLKAAFRALRSSKTFTLVALIVLTLGIGATTAIYSVVDAVVLRGLPFDEHDRLVAVGERRPPGPIPNPNRDPDALQSIAPQNYLDWVTQQQVFDAMAAIASSTATLREPGAEPEEVRSQRVSAQFFDVLRVRPALGRPFTVDNEVLGRHQVAVLSDSLWRRRFGGDPAIVGRTIPLEGGAYDVVGVMPPHFAYPVGATRPTELWVPLVIPEDDRIRIPNRISIYLQSIARLKDGISIEQAQAQMDQVAMALETAHPVWNKDNKIGVRRLIDHWVGARTKSWMLMLLGAVALVLLIACANVANLLLARASVREREVAVRSAMGAGRLRLVRQLMIESLMLSILGTAFAIVLAWWAVQILRSAMPEGVPRVATLALDFRVLAAAAALSIITGVLFGIVPALQLSKPDLANSLKEGTHGAGTGRARQRMRSALVVAEVGLAVVLMVGAALFIGSFITLMRIDPGFNTERVLTVLLNPRFDFSTRQAPPDASPAFIDLVDRVRQIPGVVHAAAIGGGMPLGGSMTISTLYIPGRTLEGQDASISMRLVTSEYHRAMMIPLRSGRFFDISDRKDATNVVILNESAVKQYFPSEDPLGRHVNIGKVDRTIVGVVGDVYQSSLESAPRSEAYMPMAQGRTLGVELIVRTSSDPYEVLPAVKAAVFAVLPDVPLRNVRTLEELVATRVAQRRFNMLLLGLFGLLGLVIAAVGIYGVMAYVVSQRTREIGVRMALGASRSTVVGMVMKDATILVGIGLVVGTIGAWYLSAAAKPFLFRLETTDVRAFAFALVALGAAALIASMVPARRAASVDPVIALRTE